MILDEKSLRSLFIQKYSQALAEKTGRDEQDILNNGLLATDFKAHVFITHEDGSTVNYRYAFVVVQDDCYAVFTEHCGYHEFKKIWLDNIDEHTEDAAQEKIEGSRTMTNKTYTVKLQPTEDGSGDMMLEIPDEILTQMELKEHDVVDIQEVDGVLVIKKVIQPS